MCIKSVSLPLVQRVINDLCGIMESSVDRCLS